MSYLVLARKYRPKTFNDVVGQPHVIRPLSNALKSGRIAHAYLFTGARGVGKTTAARLLAMALNCMAPEEERPCGVCESCLEISEGQGVDVFEIDGASNRGINEIRELRETIKYLPSKGRYKVYIIDEVHMLTKEAFNALLKTLEEPPEHVVFIFATTEVHKVLPTILSRCQRYDFKRIGLNDIIDRLRWIAEREGIDVGDKALRLLARESEGGLRDALSLFDQVIAFSGMQVKDEDVAEALGLIDQTLISSLAGSLLDGDAGSALDLLDNVYNFGHDTKDFASQVLEYFRSLVIVKVSNNPEKILDMLDAELADLKRTAQNASLETINFHFNAWLDVQARLHRSNRPRLVLEALVVKLAQVEPIRPLAEIAARLESFLNSMGGRGGAPPGSSGFSPQSRGGSQNNYTMRSGSGERTFEQRPAVREPEQYISRPIPEKKTVDEAITSDEPEIKPEKPEEIKSAAPQYDGPLDWDSFSEKLKANGPIQYNFVMQGDVRSFSPEKVEIVFGSQGTIDTIDRDRLADLLKEFFGRLPEIKLTAEEGAVNRVAAQAAKRAEEMEKTKEEILRHPVIQEAARLFNGEFVDFIPENQENES